MHGRCAKPLYPRQEQSRTSGAPESSCPSSRQSQHDAPSGAVLQEGGSEDEDALLIVYRGGVGRVASKDSGCYHESNKVHQIEKMR